MGQGTGAVAGVSEMGSFHLKLSELGVKVASLVWFLSSFLIYS